jgi:hypothetical protein
VPSWHAQGLHLLPVLIILSHLRLDLFNCCFLHISFPDENVRFFLVGDTCLHPHHLDLIILILDCQLKRTHFAEGHLVPFFVTDPNTLFRSSLPVCRRLRPSFTPNKTADKITVFTTCGGPGELSQHCDSLRAGRSGDRIQVWVRFTAPVQTGPGTHPAFYTMGPGSFPGVKRPGHGVGHLSPSSVEVKERV